jgi:transposase
MTSTTHFQGQSTLNELFTVVYVFVDDYVKASLALGRFKLPTQNNQQGSYAELMTIALVGELLSQPYAGKWFSFVKVEYAALFPVLPHRTRYHRILKKLERIFADFALRFPKGDTLHVIDSKPVPICKGARWKRPRAMTEATSGTSSLGKFYGFKLHAITDQQGLICRFALVPAHEHDVTVARQLLETSSALVIGDKAYAGAKVYAQPKDNERHPRLWTPALAWLRKSIESVFSSLLRTRHLALAQLNSFWAVRASVCRKIAAHNLAWFLTH